MKKLIVVIVSVLVLGLLIFYFWGSSSTSNQDEFDKVVTYTSPVQNEPDTLSVLTFNIGYLSGMTNNLPVSRDESLFSSNLKRSVDVLERYDFDFIGLQEVDFNSARSFEYNQFDSLGNELDFYQGAYAVNWDKSYVPFPYLPIRNHFGKMLSGQGILSKMQIVSNEIIVLDRPINAPFYYNAFYLDRLLQISKVQIESDTLVLMNVHLEAFDRETREQQADKVLKVFKSYAYDYPVILMGDFNSRPPFASEILEVERTIDIFMKNPLLGEAISKDRYLQDEQRFFTFNTEQPYERLDYIFYNKNKIRKIESEVLREAGDISDHLPVWTTFMIME
ncbi:Metal-dependent hydrolase, endonuclease/exonuclease/phosphatase family [Marivirga sericea]|uniref:Metal-dependent hydrolase, endonuclease/exonuclease/phosphatase family n=1 Tax=Marivirga sericea TaxID=1028 RepID=A0A1X7I4N3_9BACT|nr:endonuclease/exonuclease/phosphatase family protein [Marivirga sericea]SMG09405.1 Metal-dependent hydrolase, endonuclease/exonuclease/phosphatase family [Marivirga sericea]